MSILNIASTVVHFLRSSSTKTDQAESAEIRALAHFNRQKVRLSAQAERVFWHRRSGSINPYPNYSNAIKKLRASATHFKVALDAKPSNEFVRELNSGQDLPLQMNEAKAVINAAVNYVRTANSLPDGESTKFAKSTAMEVRLVLEEYSRGFVKNGQVIELNINHDHNIAQAIIRRFKKCGLNPYPQETKKEAPQEEAVATKAIPKNLSAAVLTR